MLDVQKALIHPITPALSGAVLGHTDAVVAIVITDTGLVMTGSNDRSLCVFDISRPAESVRKIENAHDKVRAPLEPPALQDNQTILYPFIYACRALCLSHMMP